MPTESPLRIIDADGHIVEPDSAWTDLRTKERVFA